MKKYNYNKIRKEVRKIVKKACYSRNNKFSSFAWECHILPVVEHSLVLGKKLSADLEVLEIAALLHDYAVVVDIKLYKDHHLHGSNFAEKILKKFKFPEDKIERVKKCIISHRGSVIISKRTKEEKIIASADAMAHITNLADMFKLTFSIHKFNTLEGAQWLKNKLERSWNKMIPEGKKLVKDDYRIALKILNNAIRRLNRITL